FEPELYNASGLRATFVGHPMMSVIPSGNAAPPRDDKLVGLFPGSREREVKKIFPVMRQAALELSHQDRDLRFVVSAASEPLAELIRADLYSKNATGKFSVVTGDARPVMRRVNVGMVASGTATRAAALSELPFVILYRVAWLP